LSIDFTKITVVVSEACLMLGIGRTKLYQMMGSGEVRAVRIGGRTLIDAASLRALVDDAAPWNPTGSTASNHTDQAA